MRNAPFLLPVFFASHQSKAVCAERYSSFLLPPHSQRDARKWVWGFPYAHKIRAFELSTAAGFQKHVVPVCPRVLSISRRWERPSPAPSSVLVNSHDKKQRLITFLASCFSPLVCTNRHGPFSRWHLAIGISINIPGFNPTYVIAASFQSPHAVPES